MSYLKLLQLSSLILKTFISCSHQQEDRLRNNVSASADFIVVWASVGQVASKVYAQRASPSVSWHDLEVSGRRRLGSSLSQRPSSVRRPSCGVWLRGGPDGRSAGELESSVSGQLKCEDGAKQRKRTTDPWRAENVEFGSCRREDKKTTVGQLFLPKIKYLIDTRTLFKRFEFVYWHW